MRMTCLYRSLFLLQSFNVLVLGDYWLWPPPGPSNSPPGPAVVPLSAWPIFVVGTIQPLTWNSSDPTVFIDVVQAAGNHPSLTVMGTSSNGTNFDWTVTANTFDLSQGVTFYFRLWQASNTSNSLGSHVDSQYVNITTAATSLAPTQTVTTTLQPTSHTTASPTSSPSVTAIKSASSSGLSHGAAAGIGVSVALLAIALVVIAFLTIRLLRHKSRERHNPRNPAESYPVVEMSTNMDKNRAQEMPAQSKVRSELDESGPTSYR